MSQRSSGAEDLADTAIRLWKWSDPDADARGPGAETWRMTWRIEGGVLARGTRGQSDGAQRRRRAIHPGSDERIPVSR